MATIANAKLAISVNLPTGTAKVLVTCDVRFSQLEIFLMKNGLRFRLNCQVWGEDNGQGAWVDPDDHLFNYASVFFPDATPTSVEKATFETTVSLRVLQEDSGTDEIYGQLILRTLENGSSVRRKTNTVVHQFG